MLPETTIVIAAYNEEKRLPDTLLKIDSYLSETGENAEIIVVDDGSTDNTAAVVMEHSRKISGLRLISYARNRGKGYALRKGVAASRGAMVLLTDADLSTPIDDLENLRSRLSSESCEVAIGSRGLPLSQIVEAQPAWRRGMSRLFGKLVSSLVIDDFQDTQCGFKLFKAETARALFAEAQIDRFAYDVEILALARKNGYRVVEVPVRWKNSRSSKVRPVRDSLQMAADLVKIRMRLAQPKNAEELSADEALDPEL